VVLKDIVGDVVRANMKARGHVVTDERDISD
jgi:hypothetical protein